ncbi:MAG: hypothetical protein JNK90_06945 [Planctomycetaceae bacterium]|nr:hypothetical protein [Planctomycetaceae bacterium]
MILVREKLPFVDALLSEHFRGFRLFRGCIPNARPAVHSISQGSWSVWCVGEAGASNAVRYTTEPCNEYNRTAEGHPPSIGREKEWAKREVIRNNIEPYIELDVKSGFLLGFYTDSVDEKLLQMADIWGLISDADKDFILSFMERIRSQKL